MSIIDLRSAVAAVLAGGSSDDGTVKIAVETNFVPQDARGAHRRDAVTWDPATATGTEAAPPSSFKEAARAALPNVAHQLWGADAPRPQDHDTRTDHVALIEAADGSIYIVGRVKP